MGSAEDAAAQRRARAEARKRRVLSGGTDRLAAVTRLRAEIEHEGAFQRTCGGNWGPLDATCERGEGAGG